MKRYCSRNSTCLRSGDPQPHRPDRLQHRPRLRQPSSAARSQRLYGSSLPEDAYHHRRVRAAAGQSFGAFMPKGVTMRLAGDCNDYLGKGLSGRPAGAVRPPKSARFARRTERRRGQCGAATARPAAEAYVCGHGGRALLPCAIPAPSPWSRAVGDHGCEYMTGGCVAVLGRAGQQLCRGHVRRRGLRAGRQPRRSTSG